jgi:hypothetical protein
VRRGTRLRRLKLCAGQFGISWENLGVNGIAEPSQGNLVTRRVTNQGQPVDEAGVDVCIVPTLCPLDVSPYDFSASLSCNGPRRALENGSTAAAFRGDPGLPNLRRTTIEWITMLPGMRAWGALGAICPRAACRISAEPPC